MLWANPASFVYFQFFNQIIRILQQINVNIVCLSDSNSEPPEYESPVLTTRPGLRAFVLFSLFLQSHLTKVEQAVDKLIEAVKL